MQRRRFSTRLQSSSLSSTIHNESSQVGLFQRISREDVQSFDLSQGSASAKNLGPKIGRFTWSSRDEQTNKVVGSTETLPQHVEYEERVFHEYFSKEVSALLRRFSDRFPYRHLIQWSMQVGSQSQHDLDIEIKPPAST